jgi:hypothetical protein
VLQEQTIIQEETRFAIPVLQDQTLRKEETRFAIPVLQEKKSRQEETRFANTCVCKIRNLRQKEFESQR